MLLCLSIWNMISYTVAVGPVQEAAGYSFLDLY